MPRFLLVLISLEKVLLIIGIDFWLCTHEKAVGFLHTIRGGDNKTTYIKFSGMSISISRRPSFRIDNLNNYEAFRFAVRTQVGIVVEFFFGDLYPGVFDFSPFWLLKVFFGNVEFFGFVSGSHKSMVPDSDKSCG